MPLSDVWTDCRAGKLRRSRARADQAFFPSGGSGSGPLLP